MRGTAVNYNAIPRLLPMPAYLLGVASNGLLWTYLLRVSFANPLLQSLCNIVPTEHEQLGQPQVQYASALFSTTS